MRTMRVEEELLLIDEKAGDPLPAGEDVRANATDERLTTEFKLQQTEFAAEPHASMDSLATDIRQLRINAAIAAVAEFYQEQNDNVFGGK